jgi:hypothetical protein
VSFNGVNHPNRGDVVEVESYDAARYFAHEYAQPASVPELVRTTGLTGQRCKTPSSTT